MPEIAEAVEQEVSAQSLIDDFEHQSIEDYNPDFTPVPEDVYELKLVGEVYTREGISEKLDDSGNIVRKPWFRKSMRVGIVNHPRFAGRTVFFGGFPGEFMKFVKKIQDVTGFSQDANETVSGYLEKVAGAGATFRGKITVVKDYRGEDSNELVVASLSKVG